MKTWMFFFFFLCYSIFPGSPADQGKNNTGCGGSGCHLEAQDGFEFQQLENLKMEVSLKNKETGGFLSAELVDANGDIVDYIPVSSHQSVLLCAPSTGSYTINAATNTGGLRWMSKKVTITKQNFNFPDVPLSKSKFEFYPNHPNPFHQKTFVIFSLNQPAMVSVDIYSSEGKFIQKVTNRDFPSGIHHVEWDGLNELGLPVPSGLYFCQIKSGKHSRSRAIILSRQTVLVN